MTQLSLVQQQAARQVEDNDTIDLSVLLSTLWRGKWWIGLATFISMIAALYYVLVIAVPLYRASAVVILETKQESIVDFQSVVGGLSGDSSEVNSEVEVLRSRGLMGKVVDRLGLISDPEYNHSLLEPGFIETTVDNIKNRLVPSNSNAPQLTVDQANKRERDSVISMLLESVQVRNIPQSLVFQITAESKSPEKSALIADTIVELYIVDQLEVKFEATEQATGWLTNRVAELQVLLEEAEAKVADFNSSTDLVSIASLQGLERQLKELRDRITTMTASTASANERATALRSAKTREEQAKLSNDAQLDRFLLRAEVDASMATAFDTRFAQILTRADLEVTRGAQQIEALTTSEATLEKQIGDQSQDLITLQQLIREAEANRLLYEYFLGRLKETSAQEGIQSADSRILSNAVVPSGASAPRKPLALTMAGILGFMIGSALVLLHEARNNNFRTANELETYTGYTVLGQIPTIPARNRQRILGYLSEKPTSAAAEAVRNLRTSVMLSNVDHPPKIIVSTSSVPGEGKTTNSLALAQNLVGMGKKVLLIEGDIRRRTFNQYFDNIPAKGMVSVLSGEMKVDDVIFQSPGFGADLLVGEKTNINAADLFTSSKFKALLAELRQRYDTIVIDTPPVLIVPDARIISQMADAVLFTVKWDTTSKAQVDESLRLFRDAKQKVTGLILSQIDPKGMKRYGYGGKSGAYAAYDSGYYNN